jgi:hypothetical protein
LRYFPLGIFFEFFLSHLKKRKKKKKKKKRKKEKKKKKKGKKKMDDPRAARRANRERAAMLLKHTARQTAKRVKLAPAEDEHSAKDMPIDEPEMCVDNETRLGQLMGDVCRLKTELDASKEENACLARQVDKHDAVELRSGEVIVYLNARIGTLRDNVSRLANELDASKKENARLTAEIAKQAEKVLPSDDASPASPSPPPWSPAEPALGELAAEALAAKEIAAKEIAAARLEVDKLAAGLKTEQARHDAAKKLISALERELESVRRDRDAFQTDAAKAIVSMERLEDIIEEHKTQIKVLNMRIDRDEKNAKVGFDKMRRCLEARTQELADAKKVGMDTLRERDELANHVAEAREIIEGYSRAEAGLVNSMPFDRDATLWLMNGIRKALSVTPSLAPGIIGVRSHGNVIFPSTPGIPHVQLYNPDVPCIAFAIPTAELHASLQPRNVPGPPPGPPPTQSVYNQ